MKAAKPVEIDNKSHQNQLKKQKQKEPVVVHQSEVEVGTQMQKPTSPTVVNGSVNLNGNLNLNGGTIAGAHDLQNIYGQGAEKNYGKLQESLTQTGDFNNPETKEIEKGYMATLNVDQARNYNDLKSGTYLPKTMQEQAAMVQSAKGNTETAASEMSESVASVEIQSVQNSVAASDMSAEFVLPAEQEDAVRTTPTSPKSDPNFNQAVGLVKNTAKAKRVHNTKEKAEIHAKAAAAVPDGERKSKARGQQVEQLDQQKSGSFTAIGFKSKLKERIKEVNLPEKQGDAENFEKRNNINTVNRDIKKDVMTSKNSVTGSIQAVAKKEPNEAEIAQRKSTALPDPKIGSKVNIKATDAMPPKRGDSELSVPIAKSYKAVEQQFAKNNITDEQLANSNEPDFIDALNAKKAAKENAENAPKEFKNAENKKLEASKQAAQSKTNSTMEGMHHSRKGLLDSVTNKQHKAGKEDTAKHKDVVEKLNTIYQETKKSVGEQLNDLETKVTQLFDDGAKKAKSAFEKEVTQKLEDYKAKRYGKWYSVDKYGERWEDFRNGKLPDEVDKFYKKGKENFITAMDTVIGQIAELVATRLNKAKASITSGRQKVVSFIKNLPADIKKAMKGDIDAIQGQFKELESSISDKESSLIDTLTTKYNNALKEVDELIAEIKKRNLGFLSTLEEKTLGVWKTIQEIKKTLTEILSGAVSAIMAIVADPIGFLSNLIDGVSQGFINFGTNIWTHLKTGFFGWLTGAMKGISLTMPEDVFSLKGVFSITSQVLGLTWGGIRAIGARVIGEPIMKVLETASEKGLEIVQVVRKDGAAGLWEYLKDQFADLKTTVMDAIMDIIQSQVIQAGIKFVLGLLTPVGAFIKAAMAIIDVVKFFIQRAAQIMELVKAFSDSIKAIASGNVGAVAKSIENALGRAIPVLIGFLASLLNLGGLADKVLGVIRKIRLRIENAIVKFWNFIKGKAAKLLSKTGIGKLGKKKEKVDDKHIKNMDSEIAPEPFTMNGESHTLMFENGEIYMASEKAPLTYKLTKFKNYVSRKPDADEFGGDGYKILNGIEELQTRNERVKKDLTNAKNRVEGPEKDQKMKEAEAKFDKLSKDIEKFGNKFKLEDLIESSKKTKYKPEKIDFYISGDKQITIGYHYDVEVNGRNEKRTFKSSFKLNKNNLIEQQTIGFNLVTKESGSRSYTESANQAASNKAIEDLKKNPEEQIEFNASHILADLFLGSGYKTTLNLITASGDYNKNIMKGAEDRLKRELSRVERKLTGKNSPNYVTFDIRITATWQELVDNSITSQLAELNPNVDQELLKSIHKILARNVDPKLVQGVVYEVIKAKLNGTKEKTHGILPIRIGADEALKTILK